MRTPGEERWVVEEVWGVGGWGGDRGQASGRSCRITAACLMNALSRWDRTSERTLLVAPGEWGPGPRRTSIQRYRRGKAVILRKKKFIILKCFTLGMTMCLHNTYRRVKPLYIEK